MTTTGAAAAGERGSGGTRPSGPEPLGSAVFALLVVACFAAFFLTQRLKHTPTAIQRFQLTTRFSPVPSGRLKQERISFKLARADEVTVSIIDTKGDVVATLLRDYRVPRYKQLSLRWNGHRGEARAHRLIRSPSGHVSLLPENRGRLAAAGEYRVQVSLREQGRTVRSPRSFSLVTR